MDRNVKGRGQKMTLTGRTALITGAAGAIGSAAARLLSQAGARLVLADMVRDPTEDLSRELGGLAVQADLSDPGAVSGMAASVLDQVGRIDILVNNAGALNNAKIATTTLEEWHRVQSINVDAAFLLSQAFLPGMRAARWGRVINLSSYAAKSGGLTAGTAYSVSKAAMIGLTFSIAREVAGEGVTANAIAPAYV
nr:SDR family NAD(P)-dependent oxidoreductase [Rhodobacter sp.]